MKKAVPFEDLRIIENGVDKGLLQSVTLNGEVVWERDRVSNNLEGISFVDIESPKLEYQILALFAGIFVAVTIAVFVIGLFLE